MTHAEKAKELFLSGGNCSQAVVGAFAEDMGLDTEYALRLSSSFGGGMGRMREVCGAVSGMLLVIGVLYGYSDIEDIHKKTGHYALVRDAAERFREMSGGSIICRELLAGLKAVKADSSPVPTVRNDEFYSSRPCLSYVLNAVKITEDIIREKQQEEAENAKAGALG